MTEGAVKKTGKKREHRNSTQNKDEENETEKHNSEGEETEKSTTKSEKIRIKKRKKEKQVADNSDNDSDDGDREQEKRLLSEMNKAKIERVKKLKSRVLEKAATAVQHEKNTEDIEAAEKAKEVEEMKERKRRKRREKKQALKKKKEAQQNRKSGAGGEMISVAKTEALKYLQTWSSDRKQWKFNKVRQVWLIKHMYDEEMIGDEDFENLLLYLEGMKGKSRDQTVKEAEELVNQSENSATESSQDEKPKKNKGPSLSSVNSERLRKVLQILT